MLHFQMIKTLFKLFEFDQSKQTLFEPKYNTLLSPLAFSAVGKRMPETLQNGEAWN